MPASDAPSVNDQVRNPQDQIGDETPNFERLSSGESDGNASVKCDNAPKALKDFSGITKKLSDQSKRIKKQKKEIADVKAIQARLAKEREEQPQKSQDNMVKI